MALISIPNTFTVGQVIIASAHNSNFTTIYSDYNGNIDNTNIAASAGIVDTKLGAISTAGKVSGAAFTSLTLIPSGAGLIPVANIDTGTTASKIVKLDGSAKLPAVDGSALTSLTLTGTLTGSVNLNGGTISNGSLAVNSQTSHAMSNGETFMIPSGYYVNGFKRGSGGELDTVFYAKP